MCDNKYIYFYISICTNIKIQIDSLNMVKITEISIQFKVKLRDVEGRRGKNRREEREKQIEGWIGD